MGRTTLAEAEFEAGIAKILREDNSSENYPLIRPTHGHAFGMVGGMKIVDEDGRDSSAQVKAGMADAEYDALMAKLNYEMERAMLRGPSDKERSELRRNPQYQPERALAGQRSRLAWELEGKRLLNEDAKWRRGRLRDVVGGRELAHEWLDMLNRIRHDRAKAGRPFEPTDDQMRDLIGAMPHSQVAISVKTRFHRNRHHEWTTNHISDIDAVSVAYPYCEAVFPDKEVRAALLNSKELRTFKTFVPRRPAELAEWLDALPTVVAPDLLLPHPLSRFAA